MGKNKGSKQIGEELSSQEACEVTVVSAVFILFLGEMFIRLRNEYVPSRISIPRLEASLFSGLPSVFLHSLPYLSLHTIYTCGMHID
jgi:hypothetical protein